MPVGAPEVRHRTILAGVGAGRCDTGVMRIYTRTGDDGTTGRLYGGRVHKTADIVEAAGDVDELISVLGFARAHVSSAEQNGQVTTESAVRLGEQILRVQRELFVLGADISANPERRHRLTPGVSILTEADVASLEERIDDVVAAHPLRPVFIVPGATMLSAYLDHARTVARRAERSCLRALDAGGPVSGEVLRYLNRLSDLLFVLARAAAGEAEEPASHD